MTSVTTRSAADTPAETRGFAGHPSGLATLFFTEMWERFSYYGMRAFLILYMVAPAAQGGLGFADADAASIYGTYTGAAWGAAIFGGLVADRFLGQYRTVLVGGIIIALGHFVLAFKALPFFYTGLTFVALGTGLLKPNVSTLVGSLYEPGDRRRDAGFSIFYMGINLGALLGPLVAGYLAQRVNWHIGFSAAGVGMTAGLIQYALGKRKLQAAVDRLAAQSTAAPGPSAAAANAAAEPPSPRPPATASPSPPTNGPASAPSSSSSCSRRCSGAPTNRPARRSRCSPIATRSSPSSASSSPPPGSRWCSRRASSCSRRSSRGSGCDSAHASPRAPRNSRSAWSSSASRSSCSCQPPRWRRAGIRVSPWWLITAYAITELGELCISPVGLSLVTKLAPLRILGLMMGVWFLSNSAGNKLAGYAASFFSTMPLDTLFGTVAAITIVAGVVLAFMVKPIRRMMGGVL